MFYFSDFSFFIVQMLILVQVLQCSTRLATCNLNGNELIAKFARVFAWLKLPVIQYGQVSPLFHVLSFCQTFTSNRCERHFEPFHLPDGASLASALDRVLRLPSVASKRYLTNKV